MTNDPKATKTLSKRGDVILHVGEGQETEYQLLVSSVLLSHVSPVFEAMFDGRFAEGQALSTASPRVISLPDDDAESTYTVCRIIHAQTADLSATATPTELANIAIFCNKYDCVDPVRSWGIIWVAHILKTPNEPDFEKALIAAYLLDLAPEFLEVSRSLIRDRSELLSSKTLSNGDDLIPKRLAELIIHEQQEIRKRVLEAVGSIVPETGTMCDPFQLSTFNFLRELRKAGLWPLCVRSVAGCKKALKDIPKQDPRSKNFCNGFRCLCLNSLRSGNQSVDKRVKDIYESAGGFCLDCVKREEKAAGNRPTCRVPCFGNNLKYD